MNRDSMTGQVRYRGVPIMSQPATAKLPPEALSQLKSVLDGYDQLAADVADNDATNSAVRALKAQLENAPETLWWSDVGLAELCIVQVLDREQLRARISSWRRRMGEVVGPSRYAAYLATALDPLAANATLEQLRAELTECISAVYYFYAAYGIAARSRSEVTKSLFRVAVSVVVIEAVLVFLLGWRREPGSFLFMPQSVQTVLQFVLATSIAAVCGSVVSVQRRLQDPNVDVDPFYRYVQTKADRFSVAFVSPVYGAIFGMVIYGILASNLVSSTLIHFNADAGPKLSSDVAALLLLGFLAGFAEQLVPDVLTRLAARTLGGGSEQSETKVLRTPIQIAPVAHEQAQPAGNSAAV